MNESRLVAPSIASRLVRGAASLACSPARLVLQTASAAFGYRAQAHQQSTLGASGAADLSLDKIQNLAQLSAQQSPAERLISAEDPLPCQDSANTG